MYLDNIDTSVTISSKILLLSKFEGEEDTLLSHM